MKARLLAAGLGGILLTGCPAAKTDGEKIPVLKVGMDPVIGAPFIYKATPDTYGGFEYDIAQYLAEQLGYQLQVVETPWDQLFKRVATHKIDMALNAIEKPSGSGLGQLPPNLSFSTHYYTAFQQLVVPHKDTFTYNLSDLKNKPVGVVKDSIGEVLLTDLNRLKQAAIQVRPYPTPEALFAALQSGKIKATLTERALAGWEVSQHKDLKLTGEKITQDIPYVAVVPQDNPELLNKINQTLEKARKDKAFLAIFSKWGVSMRY